MKITLFMEMSLNGYITGQNDDTDWVKDTASLTKMITEYGACIMGRRTYDICLQYNDFPFKGAINVVMTHDSEMIAKSTATEIFTNKDITEIIKIIENKDIHQMIIVGGGKINSQFLAANLIDEIIVDIHPLILDTGIKLFEDIFPCTNLELIESNTINDSMVQNHYKVIK